MKHDYGNNMCIFPSGMQYGLFFCASGLLKTIRNLDAYEMVQQVLLAEKTR